MKKIKILLLLLSTPVLLTLSCEIYRTDLQQANFYYLNPEKNLSEIGRVVIVELNNSSSYPQISGDVTETLFQALQKKHIFGLTTLRQNDPMWRSLQIDLRAPHTFKKLSDIQKQLGCNTIITGTVTGYRPYPHTSVSLHLKLIDLTDGSLIWGLEQIWDSADKATEARIQQYCKQQGQTGPESMREQLTTISSLRFIKFVVYEVAESLRPKN